MERKKLFQNLDKTSTTNDITGTKTHSVFDLFVLSIKYVKNMAIRDVNRQVITYAEDEAFYVIVIPGTSTDRAKWFLRQAAIKVSFIFDVRSWSRFTSMILHQFKRFQNYEIK